jgi:hypothetical protein
MGVRKDKLIYVLVALSTAVGMMILPIGVDVGLHLHGALEAVIPYSR